MPPGATYGLRLLACLLGIRNLACDCSAEDILQHCTGGGVVCRVINGSNRLTIRPKWLGGEKLLHGDTELPSWVDLALDNCLLVETMLSFSKRAVYLHLVLAAKSGLWPVHPPNPKIEFHGSAMLLFSLN